MKNSEDCMVFLAKKVARPYSYSGCKIITSPQSWLLVPPMSDEVVPPLRLHPLAATLRLPALRVRSAFRLYPDVCNCVLPLRAPLSRDSPPHARHTVHQHPPVPLIPARQVFRSPPEAAAAHRQTPLATTCRPYSRNSLSVESSQSMRQPYCL